MLALREKEFVEAARMVGASDFWIMCSHLLPHGPSTTIVVASSRWPSTSWPRPRCRTWAWACRTLNASWGKLLDSAVAFYTIQPWLIVWPGLALLITTLSFNLLGDGLRDAFVPRATL